MDVGPHQSIFFSQLNTELQAKLRVKKLRERVNLHKKMGQIILQQILTGCLNPTNKCTGCAFVGTIF